MGKMAYLAMEANQNGSHLIESDLRELRAAMVELALDAVMLANSLGSATTFLKLLASSAAIYLLLLDRTHWRTDMRTSLLVPYIFLSLPKELFHLLRKKVGRWVAFVVVLLRLFFPRHFPAWLEVPGSVVLLLVVTPKLLVHHMRGHLIGVVICLAIACYLLHEHVRASGGFRHALTHKHGVPNTIGIILLLSYPIWRLLHHFLW